MNFGTFVCTVCSGIHREFSHRQKSIGLSNFTEDEVTVVVNGGNDKVNALYMARHDPRHDLAEPDGNSVEKRREFIRTKYVDRRWYATPEDMARQREREQRTKEARPTGVVPVEPLRRRKSAARVVTGIDQPGGLAHKALPMPRGTSAAAAAAGGDGAANGGGGGGDLLDLLSSPAPEPTPAVQAGPPPPLATGGGAQQGYSVSQQPPVSPWNAFGGPAAPVSPWDAFGGSAGAPTPPAVTQHQPPQQQHQQQPPPQQYSAMGGGFGLV
ncbi:unnamed protein product, partial [Phaeothamnion confervicola]